MEALTFLVFSVSLVTSAATYLKDTFQGGQQCSSLRAAGAIGDVISREGVAQVIELIEAIREGKPQAAAAAMRTHLETSLGNYQQEARRRLMGDLKSNTT